ncbi:MAG: YigZ family protein [Muribaculaceae bacterium]|nr:YigZ family protein [Muribaculaceae bacterium]
MADYLTVKTPGEGLVREKMSRFISFALHAETPEEAASLVKDYQNKYCDSRHVCWAYILGVDGNTWQANDNGEPSGTAGRPILGQIRSKGLTNTLVVVVRYFGGIKLGTSGLIAAYKAAACEALDNAEIVECSEMVQLNVSFSYMEMNEVMKYVKANDLQVLDKAFDNVCNMTLSIAKDDLEKTMAELQSHTISLTPIE